MLGIFLWDLGGRSAQGLALAQHGPSAGEAVSRATAPASGAGHRAGRGRVWDGPVFFESAEKVEGKF